MFLPWHNLSLEKRFYTFAVAITFFKIIIATLLPLTGDEAYFILWSRHLAPTFYDHPPMIGIVLSLLSTISENLGWLRFPAVFLPVILSWIVFWASHKTRNGYYAALTLLFAPFDILNLLITNDTTLLGFGFFSLYLYIKGQERESIFWACIAGVLFGGAFLSKYLAIFLAVAMIGATLSHYRSKKGLMLLGVTVSMATLFGLFNLWANAHNCFTNFAFNLGRSSEPTPFDPINTLTFALFVVYLLTPTLFFYAFKNIKKLFSSPWGVASLIFWGLFTLLSFKKEIGLHWLLLGVPMSFMALVPLTLPWQKIAKHSAIIGIIHSIILVILVSIPYEALSHTKAYQKHIHYLYPQKVYDILKPYEKEYKLATTSYSASAYLYAQTHTYFSVLGGGSKHGREDDRLTDYSLVEGKNIALIGSEKKDFSSFIPYFDTYSVQYVPIEKGQITLFLGQGFNYDRYREEILLPAYKNYYKIPEWFGRAHECFWDKYAIKEPLCR